MLRSRWAAAFFAAPALFYPALFNMVLCSTYLFSSSTRAVAQSPEAGPGLRSLQARAHVPDPRPDKDGVYTAGSGVSYPRMTHREPAVFPAGVDEARHSCTVSAVIGVDGTPTQIHVVGAPPGAFDDAAIAAVKQSTFLPGKLRTDNTPAPTRVYIWVPFVRGNPDRAPETFPFRIPRDSGMYTQPSVVHASNPEYSAAARKAHVQGNVMVQVLVTADGTPADIHVVVPLDKGLDEQAIKAVSQYEFRPATREGMPIAVPLTIEMNFTLY